MEKRYPSIKYSKQLWDEILPIVKEWGCNIDYYEGESRIVSNFGNHDTDELIIGCSDANSIGGRRYDVKTKEEFLSAVAQLMGKGYNSNKDSVIKLSKSSKLILNFKL